MRHYGSKRNHTFIGDFNNEYNEGLPEDGNIKTIEIMKHTIKITLLFLLVSFTAMGQSTYLNPFNGATHTYDATVVDDGDPNPVRWYVATDAEGNTKANHGTDYTFITSGYNAGTDQLEANAVYSVQIEWGTGLTDGTNFYVYIEVDDDVTDCTNRMALQVTIASEFNALVYNVTGSATPGTVNPSNPANDIETETCPDDVINAVWNGTGHSNIGYSELIFRVERELSLLAWQFEYALSEASAQAFSVNNIRVVNQSGTEIYSGTDITRVQSVAATQNYVLVYVQLDNQQGVNLEMDMDLLTVNNNTKDAGDNLDNNAGDNNARHTIQPMPVISGFGGS